MSETMEKVQAPKVPPPRTKKPAPTRPWSMMAQPTVNGSLVFTIPTRQQLVIQLRAICPICQDLENLSGQMLVQMRTWHQTQIAARAAEMAQERRSAPEEAPESSKPEGIIQKAVSAGKALTGGKASPETAEIRLKLCEHGEVFCLECGRWAAYDKEQDYWFCGHGCEWKIAREQAEVDFQDEPAGRCFFYAAEPDGNYCKGCGCPQWKLAQLEKKVMMAKADCPRGLWPEDKEVDHGR